MCDAKQSYSIAYTQAINQTIAGTELRERGGALRRSAMSEAQIVRITKQARYANTIEFFRRRIFYVPSKVSSICANVHASGLLFVCTLHRDALTIDFNEKCCVTEHVSGKKMHNSLSAKQRGAEEEGQRERERERQQNQYFEYAFFMCLCPSCEHRLLALPERFVGSVSAAHTVFT